jgi:hypothetical protein
MTLGLAVTIRDGCILASDGRRTLPLAGNAVASDDVDKLEEVSTTVFAIHFGVAQASAPALAYLKRQEAPAVCLRRAGGREGRRGCGFARLA